MDTDVLSEGLVAFKERQTPSKFLFSIREKCMATPQRIVLPESTDHRILTAASVVQQKGLAQITLLGQEGAVLKVCLCSSRPWTPACCCTFASDPSALQVFVPTKP